MPALSTRTHTVPLPQKRVPLCFTSGFSLLEVLIAIVVLSIGLLGLAGLQFSALRGNNQSYERSQAHALLAEISDAMRVNRVAAGNGAFELDAGTTPADPPADCTDVLVTCTDAESAAFALATWHERMQLLLPNSTAQITCSTAPCSQGVIHNIRVIWDENRVGLDPTDATAVSCPTAATFDPDAHLACVQVSLLP
tara:strand:+ start:4336 stop:4923 length:588 start_codon:yes stop_codon:yes gene_type:complete